MMFKSLTIPEGNVVKITDSDGIVLWKKPIYTPVTSVYFDGTGMFELPFNITGADTIKAKFQMYSTSGNLFGYFESSSSNINFCLYGSSSSYIRYDGGLTRNWDIRNSTGVHEIEFSQTGLVDNGTSVATWSPKTFTGGHPTVGGLPNSTTAKAQWVCYGFEVVGKCKLKPVKRISDSAIGLYDETNDTFYAGTFLHETAPLAMVGSPMEVE